jgi:hypothetical protein
MTWRHPAGILTTDVSRTEDRTNTCTFRLQEHADLPAHHFAHSPHLYLSLGSLTVAVPEAGYFMESLQLYFGEADLTFADRTERIYQLLDCFDDDYVEDSVSRRVTEHGNL